MRILIGVIALATSLVSVADNHQRPMTSSEAVKVAIQALGHKATEHLDIQSEPHLVLTSDVDGAKEIAVFFDDCNSFGICEDITYYANFGKVSVSNARLNAWNHINSKNRTKAFRSDDDSVGVSYTISYLSPEHFNANGMLAGLFLLEAEIFGVMLGLEEEN